MVEILEKVSRKSPFVIVQKIILVNFISLVVYFGASFLVDYAEAYSHLSFSQSISYETATFIIILAFQMILVIASFLSWYFETFDISSKGISYQKGYASREKQFLPVKSFKAITYRQGLLGRLFGFGTILIDMGDNQRVRLYDVPQPQKYISLLDPPGNISKITEPEKTVKTPNINVILKKGENGDVEYKSSYRWDIKKGATNKEIEKTVMKTIAGFMNSKGGFLVIGVDDTGKILGLINDYKSLKKPNSDGFENHFNLTFKKMIGIEYRQFVELTFHKVRGKELCLVKVEPSDKPIYLKFSGLEEFYVRTGNATSPLSLSEAATYIKSHWK